jgi:hypothetical protein
MNYLIGSSYQELKAKHCPEYRKVLNLMGQHASVSRRHIGNSEDYTLAIERLAYLNERIDWDLREDRHKQAMSEINKGVVGNVTFKRIMHHRDPERTKFLILALMRDERDNHTWKPERRPVKRSIAVRVRKPLKIFGFTL